MRALLKVLVQRIRCFNSLSDTQKINGAPFCKCVQVSALGS